MHKLVLWGHHIDEYKEMFDLSEADLKKRILEFASGPSAFNREISATNPGVVSCDPLFNLDRPTLKSKVALVFNDMVEGVKKEPNQFDFKRYGKLNDLIQYREEGMQAFFEDYEPGKEVNRYIPAHNSPLPFEDFYFDFALCSHYLFADLDNQDVAFHLDVIKELCRVAKEVRIFPLIDRYGNPSPVLGPVLLGLQQESFGTEVREVDYPLQHSGNAMLRVWALQCEVGP